MADVNISSTHRIFQLFSRPWNSGTPLDSRCYVVLGTELFTDCSLSPLGEQAGLKRQAWLLIWIRARMEFLRSTRDRQ